MTELTIIDSQQNQLHQPKSAHIDVDTEGCGEIRLYRPDPSSFIERSQEATHSLNFIFLKMKELTKNLDRREKTKTPVQPSIQGGDHFFLKRRVREW
jgi:hypothetical protein